LRRPKRSTLGVEVRLATKVPVDALDVLTHLDGPGYRTR
jgi:hypothetical protein